MNAVDLYEVLGRTEGFFSWWQEVKNLLNLKQGRDYIILKNKLRISGLNSTYRLLDNEKTRWIMNRYLSLRCEI